MEKSVSLAILNFFLFLIAQNFLSQQVVMVTSNFGRNKKRGLNLSSTSKYILVSTVYPLSVI